jgi:hypothetical protein
VTTLWLVMAAAAGGGLAAGFGWPVLRRWFFGRD